MRLALVMTAALLVFAARADAEETPAREESRPAAGQNEATELSGDSTLAEWQKAPSSERSRVAVALARNHLAPTATKLEVATAAMEITGCLSATARDPRLQGWKVAPTAGTCLTAPEKSAGDK